MLKLVKYVLGFFIAINKLDFLITRQKEKYYTKKRKKNKWGLFKWLYVKLFSTTNWNLSNNLSKDPLSTIVN